MRIGIGHDTHRLAAGGPLRLGGIDIDYHRHLVGHSDADVLLHAITDALLGAAGWTDIGELFPDTDPAHQGRNSADFLAEATHRLAEAGFHICNVDCIVFAQEPKLGPHKDRMRTQIAHLLGIGDSQIAVKAKTGEGIGAIGRGEIIAAQAVALIAPGVGPPTIDHD